MLGDPEFGVSYNCSEGKRGKEYERLNCEDCKIPDNEDLRLLCTKAESAKG